MDFKEPIKKMEWADVDFKESSEQTKWTSVDTDEFYPGWDLQEIQREKRKRHDRFVISPLKKGQAETMGTTLRRVLLGEVKGTAITRAKFLNLKRIDQYSPTVKSAMTTFKNVREDRTYLNPIGIQDSIVEILDNLKNIKLSSFIDGIVKASICVRGPRIVTAKDINLPSSVQIVDKDQYILTLTAPVDLSIELQIERAEGYRIYDNKFLEKNPEDNCSEDNCSIETYLVDSVFTPVVTMNYTIHNVANGDSDVEMLAIEIWTNGGLTPKEALREAVMHLIGFFSIFLKPEADIIEKEKEIDTVTSPPPSGYEEFDIFNFKRDDPERFERNPERQRHIPWDTLFIDQLGFSNKTYNHLKEVHINTLRDLFMEHCSHCPRVRYFDDDEVQEIASKGMQLVGILRAYTRKPAYKSKPKVEDFYS